MRYCMLAVLTAAALALTACEAKKEEKKPPAAPSAPAPAAQAPKPAETPKPAEAPQPAEQPKPVEQPAAPAAPSTVPKEAPKPAESAPAAAPLTEDEKALLGKWALDVESLKNALINEAKKAGQTLTPDQLLQLAESAKSMKLVIEFKADRTCEMMQAVAGINDSGKGTWTLVDGEITVKTLEKNGQPATDEKDSKATFRDGKLTIVAEGMPPLDMVRVTE